MIEGYIDFSALDHKRDTAKAVQALTLFDVERGGFENPLAIANPDDRKKVRTQRSRIRNNPESYFGASIDGDTVGYMKHAEWRLDDELPFTVGRERASIVGRINEGEHTFTDRAQRGVFGLVVSPELETAKQETIINRFLRVAILRMAVVGGSNGLLKIVLNDTDPATPIAIDQGFQATGRMGEAAGAPGLEQQLFERPVARGDLNG